MNIYALFPVIAVIAYIPLLITTLSSRPWHKNHRLFVLFLIAAMIWSLTSVFLRSNIFPQYNLPFLELILITYIWTAVQFHVFISSFYAPGQGRWLPLAYTSLIAVSVLVVMGYVAEGVTVLNGDKLYLNYGEGIIFPALPLLALAARTTYVFGRMLRVLDNPALRNQIFSLMLGLFVFILFTLLALLPWGREYAVTHFGSIIVAVVLSYAVVRHQLIDIKIVLRRGLGWVSLAIIGVVCYGLLFVILNSVLGFKFDPTATTLATALAVFVAILIYKLRNYLFITIGKALQGQSYDYRKRLSEFASKIHNVFSLKEQGGEILSLVTKAVGCKRARLLFLEVGGQDFTTQLVESKGKDDSMYKFRLSGDSLIAEYLMRERKLLTRETLAILPEFRGLWEEEKEEISSHGIELFVPLISRERLIGILVLDKKESGWYSLEDLRLLEEVTNQVAVSLEKEYLRERLREREEELSVINHCSAIITSSRDVQEIYASFITELKKVVDINWASINLIEDSRINIRALYSEIGSAWKAGEQIPMRGTGTEWVALNNKAFLESDLAQRGEFVTAKFHHKQGVRTIAYLPLIAKGVVIGSFVVGTRNPNAYSQRHMTILEQLASQIAMSIENSRLYAEAEEKARVDKLTDLLNRRSLDELMATEINRQQRYGGVFSLIILDLDGFKAFNDNYGHLAGDKLLKEIGSVLKSTIRSADQAFRYGGDEFAVLLPNTPIDAATQVADRIRRKVAAKAKTGHIAVSASIGLANWPADGVAADEIVDAADTALYRAKREGGNRSYCASGTLLELKDAPLSLMDGTDGDTLSAIFAMAEAVDAKEHYANSHWKKVKEYATFLATAVELDPEEISKLETSALLHDIGKISISEKILNKRTPLTSDEWAIIKTHPQVGVNIASRAPELALCLPGILHHHERYDGTGYPIGLKGEEIPLEARILAIADAFTAMTTVRSYSDALTIAEALEELKRGAGTQFDPNLVEIFNSAIQSTSAAPAGTKGGEVASPGTGSTDK
ncbi:MAG: diguanylate cyclase [Chloroflexi bacterium]|nr:diguanylate cyclase [Chloroflexota bacterium]